mmetsp:Transcript_31612/g.67366  ORF Transcript_31612/g.67366 Transcript_31612/m.67366 type:complete len:92 (+) Transcript_31612:56-331(+)
MTGKMPSWPRAKSHLTVAWQANSGVTLVESKRARPHHGKANFSVIVCRPKKAWLGVTGPNWTLPWREPRFSLDAVRGMVKYSITTASFRSS